MILVQHVYYSDKINGPPKPAFDEISDNAWRGINSVVFKWWEQNAFTGFGKNGLFENLLSAEIPNLSWPISDLRKPELIDILDLIEFCHKNIISYTREYAGLSEQEGYVYFSKIEIGQIKFREEINQIFKRNKICFQLDGTGSIIRLIPDEFVASVKNTIFDTGDSGLDQLLETSREKFLDSDPNIRKDALEKIWDAWERLKTIESPKKNESILNLLKKTTTNEKYRDLLKSNLAN